jgi:hypothetical protein
VLQDYGPVFGIVEVLLEVVAAPVGALADVGAGDGRDDLDAAAGW